MPTMQEEKEGILLFRLSKPATILDESIQKGGRRKVK
jgi:hypothetical protein